MTRRVLSMLLVLGCRQHPTPADSGAPSTSASAFASTSPTPSAICEHGWQLDATERVTHGKTVDHDKSERKLGACRERLERVQGDPAFECMSRCLMSAPDLRVFNACNHECGVPRDWGLPR